MAELILTEKEKSADSYLDWDDNALGKATRVAITEVMRVCKEKEEQWSMYTTAAAAILVGSTVDANAASRKIFLGGFSHQGEPQGDWEVVVRQKMNPITRLYKWFMSRFVWKSEHLTINSKNTDEGWKTTDVEWKNRKVKN